jgi:exonuclease III
MCPAHKSIDQLIAEEQKKTEEARARIAALKARQRAFDRKKDNHRKIIVGAAAMAHMKIDPQFRKALIAALNAAVTEKKNRDAIPDLLDEQAFAEAMRAAAKQAASEAKEAAAEKKPAEGKRSPTQG